MNKYNNNWLSHAVFVKSIGITTARCTREAPTGGARPRRLKTRALLMTELYKHENRNKIHNHSTCERIGV